MGKKNINLDSFNQANLIKKKQNLEMYSICGIEYIYRKYAEFLAIIENYLTVFEKNLYIAQKVKALGYTLTQNVRKTL